MTVEREVSMLRRQCEQMEEAIALLRTPQKYGPAPGQNAPLDFLKVELSRVSSEAEREQLLQQSEAALEKARTALQAKEAELQNLKDDCELIAQQIISSGQAVLAAQSAYRQSLAQFEQLAAKHQRRWQQLNPGQELYSGLGRIDFPEFRMIGGKGFLARSDHF